MTAAISPHLGEMQAPVDVLHLPVRLTLDGTTVVVHMPRDLNTPAEVRVLRVVERFTGDFRRAVI